jgi:hypothetical protein
MYSYITNMLRVATGLHHCQMACLQAVDNALKLFYGHEIIKTNSITINTYQLVRHPKTCHVVPNYKHVSLCSCFVSVQCSLSVELSWLYRVDPHFYVVLLGVSIDAWCSSTCCDICWYLIVRLWLDVCILVLFTGEIVVVYVSTFVCSF